jgi:thiaminase
MKLLARLERIAEESLALLKEIMLLHERFVKKHGVTEEQIREGSRRLLAEWHKADAT